jgi:hypothetical protein
MLQYIKYLIIMINIDIRSVVIIINIIIIMINIMIMTISFISI